MIQITATYNQLLTREDNDLALFATPTNTGSLSGHYWASHANFADDVCVATPIAFLEFAGYGAFCRDQDYVEAYGDETYSLEVASHLDELDEE